jgi:hypothetical protein
LVGLPETALVVADWPVSMPVGMPASMSTGLVGFAASSTFDDEATGMADMQIIVLDFMYCCFKAWIHTAAHITRHSIAVVATFIEIAAAVIKRVEKLLIASVLG